MGGNYQQKADLLSLFKDVASAYVQIATVPAQPPNLIDRAMRIAIAERAPTAIIIPSDLQEETYEAPAHAFNNVPSSTPGYTPSVTHAAGDQIERAAEIINAASKVAILAGQDARSAAEVMEVAELTGAGVAKALLGQRPAPAEPITIKRYRSE